MATKAHPKEALRRRGPWVGGAAVVVLVGAALFSVHRVAASRPVSGATGPRAHVVAPRPTITSINPPPGATDVGFRAPVIVTMSRAMTRTSAHPLLAPAVAGTWSRRGSRTFVFHPSANFFPSTSELLSFPGGPGGMEATDGRVLARTVASHFTVANATTLRLQQLLAELDFLPVAFAPGSGPAPLARAATALGAESAVATHVALSPRTGSFTWRFARIPSQLALTWQPGQWNLATKGAVMAFQDAHALPVDGEPGPALWRAVLGAVATRAVSSQPYNYLLVTETDPETLYVWSNGHVVFQTPVNTGVQGAATALGTFPVYLRYTSTTMSGTNPDGSHYSDPGIPWVSYFNGGDAVHGFIRSGYGYPQSDGCVELPISNAATVYPYDNYGTLVTVTTGTLSGELAAGAASYDAPPPPPAPVHAVTTTTAAPVTTTVPPAPRRHRPKASVVVSTVPSATVPTTLPAGGGATS